MLLPWRRSAPAPLGKHIVGVEFTKERMEEHHESHGPPKLYLARRSSPATRAARCHSALSGEGLCVGYDSGDAVSIEHTPKVEFAGGQIQNIVLEVAHGTRRGAPLRRSDGAGLREEARCLTKQG